MVSWNGLHEHQHSGCWIPLIRFRGTCMSHHQGDGVNDMENAKSRQIGLWLCLSV